MPKRKARISYAQFIYSFSLFLILSVGSFFLITIGANNYKGILGESNKSFNTNSSLHYVTNKLHSYDKPDGISLGEEDGIQLIILNDDLSESGYHTLIYCYDGNLYELMKQKRQQFVPGQGIKILPIDSFSAKALSESCLVISASDKSSKDIVTSVALKSARISEVDTNAPS